MRKIQYRKFNWTNIKTAKAVFGIQARVPSVDTKWRHCCEGTEPLLFDEEEDRDNKLKELRRKEKMTKFNPDNKESLTFGDVLEPAMTITDPEDAKQYFDAYVAWLETRSVIRKNAENIARYNLGYYAGYYDQETQKRVERLFNAKHPIFGS